MRLTVVGAGYVGLASALAFAATGHEVVCVERDPDRLALLRRREDPLGEPGVATLLTSTRARFVNADPELDRAELVLVAVGTPMRRDDHADLAQVHDACRVLAVGTRTGGVVAGGPPAARPVIEELYAGIRARSAAPIPLLWTTSRSAELAKYAANGFLATKLSFVNEVANLADVVGADAGAVLRSMALDPRIGAGHLRPGLGWGGSCFPKDTRALAALAAGEGYDFIVLKAAIEQNNRQLAEFAGMIERETPAGPTIGMLGLAFKAGTADTRESPALALAERLAQTGKRVHAYDPAVRCVPCAAIARVDADPLAACVDADAVVIATDWPEFASLDLPALRAVTRGDLIFDGRGMIDPARADAAGFRYRGTGPTSAFGGAA